MLRSLTPVRSGVLFGLMAGVVCILYFVVLYFVSKKLFTGLWTYIGYIVIVFFKIVAVELARRAQKNIIYFKEALKTAFLVSVISLFLWLAFQHVMFLADPSLPPAAKQNRIEFIQWSMELSDAPEEKIQEAIKRAESADYGASLRSDALSYGFFLMVGFFYALIIAGVYHFISKSYAAHHLQGPQLNGKK